jgi:hypothetical protein
MKTLALQTSVSSLETKLRRIIEDFRGCFYIEHLLFSHIFKDSSIFEQDFKYAYFCIIEIITDEYKVNA